MDQIQKMFDDAKTMAEHESIIKRYRLTGQLDRTDAIQKYIDFNQAHPEYIATVNVQGAILYNVVPMQSLCDMDVVANLNSQLIFLGGKNLLERPQNS